MSPRSRLAIWSLVAFVLSAGQSAWLALDRERRWPGVVAFELVAICMLALILTTPADAIRLKRGHSEGLIVAGAELLQLSAGGRGVHLLLTIAVCVLLVAVTRVAGKSPWWVAVLAWNPLLLAILPG